MLYSQSKSDLAFFDINSFTFLSPPFLVFLLEFQYFFTTFLKVKAEEVTTRVENLLEELRATRNEVSALREKAAVYKASVLSSKAFSVGTSKQIRYLSVSICT